jgi:hypothetical protein
MTAAIIVVVILAYRVSLGNAASDPPNRSKL